MDEIYILLITIKKEGYKMYKIVNKKTLNPTVTEMDIYAPLVAAKAKAGQFIILRVDGEGERIPLTVASTDKSAGTVKIIFQVVGATTIKLNTLNVGDYLQDFVGPLGKPTKLDGIKRACVIGGGVGSAIAMPIAKALHEMGVIVDAIIGFRNKDLVILEDEFKSCSNDLKIMTDDGSYGEKGLVTERLKKNIESGAIYDEIFAIGPLIMMKYVVETAKPYNIKTTVSMNPIMIDGTGMCGGCRLSVGGKIKFACVDGPDFDGYEVDFDSAMERNSTYREFELSVREASCNLLKKGVE